MLRHQTLSKNIVIKIQIQIFASKLDFYYKNKDSLFIEETQKSFELLISKTKQTKKNIANPKSSQSKKTDDKENYFMSSLNLMNPINLTNLIF